MFEPFVIVAYDSFNCCHCKKMDLKIIQSLLERIQICKRCWKTKELAGPAGFFWKTGRTCSWTTIRGKKKVMKQYKNHTYVKYLINWAIILSCGLHVTSFIHLWTISNCEAAVSLSYVTYCHFFQLYLHSVFNYLIDRTHNRSLLPTIPSPPCCFSLDLE